VPFIQNLKIVGNRGALLWGYHEAAVLGSWAILKGSKPGAPQWVLSARLAWAEPFQLRQRPLLFTAPRHGGGMWAWGVEAVELGPDHVTARLGPPEH